MEIENLENMIEQIANPKNVQDVKEMSSAERLKLINQASVNFELMMQHKLETEKTRAKNEEMIIVINALKKSMRYNRV